VGAKYIHGIGEKMTNEIIDQPKTNAIDLADNKLMENLFQLATHMAGGVSATPKHLRNNVSDCLSICMQAATWGMNPFSIAPKTYFVNGMIAYEAQLVNAVVISSNYISGRFHYQYSEKGASDTDPESWVRVGAVIRGEDEIQWGERLYPYQQKVKNSPLWKTNWKQQSAYLAVKQWARIYAPHVIMGVYTPDELDQIQEKDVTPNDSDLNDLLSAKKDSDKE
jgi:hypothetical protein